MVALLGLMSSRSVRAVAFVLVLIMASLSPLAAPAAASSPILLDVSTHHVVLQPGDSTNITLTIENNGSTIESYNVTIQTGVLSSVWTVNASEPVVENVFPTWSKNTTIVIQLSTVALPSDSGAFNIHVTEPNQNVTSVITVYVSVAPSYSPLIDFTSLGSALASMEAGGAGSFTVDVTNGGSVQDTLLLDVESEPDLATWWAGQTNGSGNQTGGGNGTGNQTGGGNGTGNQTGGNSTTNTTTISNALMYGNSYTSANSLNGLLESMGVLNADAISPGGKLLSSHWTDVNTSMHASNTTLRNPSIDWDYVILQDQSQVPGFYRTNSNWIASKDGAVNFAQAVEDEGGESILFMTWGRRNGDATNPALYSNFTVMQERLEHGYIDYRDNMTATGAEVWIAPVGLAFKHIHDDVMAGGINASLSGNLFYDLYTNDGSHPSLLGSYLAACVMHATMTGESPVGSNDSVAINATIKLQLQQAAAATVFNETSHLEYPWTVAVGATASTRGLGGGVPSGWNVQWTDDQLNNMAAGTTEQATLQVTVPANVAPDYYGFRLYAASTQGNVSTSVVFVIHIDEEHNLSMVFLDQEASFIPGTAMNTTVQITNTGNAEAAYDWSVEATGGPCTMSLPVATTLAFAPNAMVDLPIHVEVDASATSSDTCDFSLTGSTADGTASFSHSTTFTINVDEFLSFDIAGSMPTIDVEVDEPTAYEMRLTNNGSEERTFVLQINQNPSLTTVIIGSSSVLVAAGEVGVWNVETSAEVGVVGAYVQEFSVMRGEITAETSVAVNVLPTQEITLDGPVDGRILMQPGTTTSTVFTLSNTGTGNASLVASLSGLPASASAEISQTSITLSVGETIDVHLNLTLANNANPGSHALVFGFGGSGASATENIEFQIQDRFEVRVSSAVNQIVAGPSNNASMSFDITNLGTGPDTIQLSIIDNSETNWFAYTLSTTSVSLDAGATTSVELTVRETSSGATMNGVTATLRATSSNDPASTNSYNVTVQPQVAGAEIIVFADEDTAQPGSSIRGTVVVQNSGTGFDQLLVTTVGMDCGLTTMFGLEAGASSPAVPWSCLIDDDAEAGLSQLVFRVTSTSRTEYIQSYSEIYEIEKTYTPGNTLDITTDASTYKVPYSGGTSVVVTINNLANTPATGSLSVIGDGSGMLIEQWTRLSDDVASNQFELAPFATVEYKLMLTSNIEADETASLSVKATFRIDGTNTSESSETFNIAIAGPAQPPQGVTLPLGIELGQSTTLNAVYGGWGVALLLIGIMYLKRSRGEEERSQAEDDSETIDVSEESVEETSLGYNECRMENGKVSCPSCEARLGVPRGSEAPFRFNCPKCQTMIRVVE